MINAIVITSYHLVTRPITWLYQFLLLTILQQIELYISIIPSVKLPIIDILDLSSVKQLGESVTGIETLLGDLRKHGFDGLRYLRRSEILN